MLRSSPGAVAGRSDAADAADELLGAALRSSPGAVAGRSFRGKHINPGYWAELRSSPGAVAGRSFSGGAFLELSLWPVAILARRGGRAQLHIAHEVRLRRLGVAILARRGGRAQPDGFAL